MNFSSTLEFQIEDTARKNLTRLKKSIRIILILSFSLQNARYQLPLGLGLTAETLAPKLMRFLSSVKFFRAVSSIWNVRVQ